MEDREASAAATGKSADDSGCSSNEDFDLQDEHGTKKRLKKQRIRLRSPYEGVMKSPYKCVRQNKSGSWSSRIRDPFKRTRIWLGSFKSAEAAYEAYCAKKQEIDKKATTKRKTKAVFDTNGDCSPTEESQGQYPKHNEFKITKSPEKREIISKSPYKCVYLRKSGKWTSDFKDPVTKTRYYLGTFTSAEAAYRAYCAKKLELETIQMEIKRRSSEEAAYGAYCAKKLEIEEKGASKEGSIEEADFASESVPVSSPCSVLKDSKNLSEVSIEMASLVVDENGFLLGEFSKIDDLSICEDVC